MITLKQEFIEDVIAMLSGNLVDVELEENDIALAFRLAKKTWQQKGNDNLDHSYVKINMTAGKNLYLFPEEVTDVVSVVRPSSSGNLGYNQDPFTFASFQQVYSYGAGGSGDGFYIYDMMKQVIENNRMYLSDEPNFRFNKRNHQLYLTNPPTNNQKWMFEVYRHSTDDEYQDVLWILNWTVAECKQILGRAYRKLPSLPSPTGESQIDGDQLVQESQQEKERLLEEIENFTDGDADGMGIYVG